MSFSRSTGSERTDSGDVRGVRHRAARGRPSELVGGDPTRVGGAADHHDRKRGRTMKRAFASVIAQRIGADEPTPRAFSAAAIAGTASGLIYKALGG